MDAFNSSVPRVSYSVCLLPQAGKGQERKYVDLLQLIHETVQRADRNCLVCPLKYPIPVELEEDEKDSGRENHLHVFRNTSKNVIAHGVVGVYK